MNIYTIYFNPSDYPGKYVMRYHTVQNGEIVSDNDCVVSDSLEGARKSLPHGLYRCTKDMNDDPVIVEVYI